MHDPRPIPRLLAKLALTTILATPLLAIAETHPRVSTPEVDPAVDEAPRAAEAPPPSATPAAPPRDGAHQRSTTLRRQTRLAPEGSQHAPTGVERSQRADSTNTGEAPAAVPSASPAEIARADERVNRTIDRLAAAAHATQRSLRIARSARDVDRTRCLDDMLSRLHMATKQGQAIRDRRTAALLAGDSRRATQELKRIAWLDDRAQRLAAEARRCDLPDAPTAIRKTGVWHYEPLLPPGADYPKLPSHP